MTNNNHSRNLKPMSSSQMSACFGVSLPTFFAWLRNILDQDRDNEIKFYGKVPFYSPSGEFTYYRWMCKRKFISPKETRKICELLGDPLCTLKFEQTTLSSIALEQKIPVKTLLKAIAPYFSEENIHYRDCGPWIDGLEPAKIYFLYQQRQNESNFLPNQGRTIRCLTPLQAKKVREAYGIEEEPTEMIHHPE